MPPRPPLTVADGARCIARELEAGDIVFALRLLAFTVADVRTRDDFEVTFAEPPSTGDHQWDTLLAGVFAREATARGETPPAWTQVPPLDDTWWPEEISDQALRERYIRETPAELAALNIVYPARGLELL